MKTRIYLRIAKTARGTIVKASSKPNYGALQSTPNYGKPLPTVQIALDLDIPDSEFQASRILLEQAITSSQPCIRIEQVNQKNDAV